MPQDALAIPNIGKTSMYALCESTDGQPHCQVFSPNGDLIWDEQFLPDDPGVTISPEELDIDVIRTEGRDFIALTSGRYLLPSTNYEDHKRVLDENRALTKQYQE